MTFNWTRFWVSVIACGCLFSAVLSVKKGYYTIVAPLNIHPNSNYHLSFTLNDFHKSCWFNITLTPFYENDNQVYAYKTVEILPETTKLVELFAPATLKTGLAYLNIYGYSGIISKDSALAFINYEHYLTFIQTNKLKYKPGELVKFRVICIDQLKRPVQKVNGNLVVEVQNSQYNVLQTFTNPKFVKGVFRGSFQLSEHTVLGDWSIETRVDSLLSSRINFKVERYILPKFNVQISSRSVSIHDEKLEFDITASYFYGEPVKGKLLLSLTNPFYQNSEPYEKETEINGMAKISFDLKKELYHEDEIKTFRSLSTDTHNMGIRKFYVEAYVTDAVSEEQAWATKEIEIFSHPFNIEQHIPRDFEPSATISIKVQVKVKDLDGNPIEVTDTPILVNANCFHESGHSNDILQLEYQEKVGEDFAILNISNKNYSYCYMKAEYQGTKSVTEVMNKKSTQTKMEILTKSPQEGKELEVQIKNQRPIDEFTYEIVSKEDIVHLGHVKVPGNETTYILRFNVTSKMVPKITIYFHQIQGMNFSGQLKDVLIKSAKSNSIEISTETETNPGKSVYINVTTETGSYVGLMGLDRSLLENLDKNKLFDEYLVNNQLRPYTDLKFYDSIQDAQTLAGLVTFSNVFPPGYGPKGGSGGFAGGGGYIKPIRKRFPDSWLFEDFETTPEGGLKFMRTVPDTITNWAITGFSIHPDSGLAFTKNITELKVFQEFFISFDLPGLLKEGEIIEVPVFINNYMNEDALVNVTFESDSEHLKILEDPQDMTEFAKKHSIPVQAMNKEKIDIFLKPLENGEFNLTVKASSLLTSDAVQKTLKVGAQGIPKAMSKSFLVHLPEDGVQDNEVTIDIPAKALPGSEKVEVTVVGDIFRPLMANLQKLVRVPYGNGEENMRFIISNCLVLKYLKTLNYSNPSLETKIRRNLQLGYQNQLSFRFGDGSFGLFDRKLKRTGDIWQTAFALWGIKLASAFIEIDKRILENGFRYLKDIQLENGCFQSGKGLQDDIRVTAFGVMVFLWNQFPSRTYLDVINKGLSYLENAIDDFEDTPTTVISNYVLLLSKHGKAVNFFKTFSNNGELRRKKESIGAKADALEAHIEKTATHMINLFEAQNNTAETLLHIVKAFIVSKEEQSSIHHIIALQVMVNFVEKLLLGNNELSVSFIDDQQKIGEFQVSNENSQVLQIKEFSPNTRNVNFQTKGHGFAVIDVKYSYNLPQENITSSIIGIDISSNKTSKHSRILKICSGFLGNDILSKFAVMHVNLQSGYIFKEIESTGDEIYQDPANDEKATLDIKSIQFKEGQEKVVVYIEFTAGNEACVQLEVRETYKVINSQPGWITIYDGSDKSEMIARSFRINELL